MRSSVWRMGLYLPPLWSLESVRCVWFLGMGALVTRCRRQWRYSRACRDERARMGPSHNLVWQGLWIRGGYYELAPVATKASTMDGDRKLADRSQASMQGSIRIDNRADQAARQPGSQATTAYLHQSLPVSPNPSPNPDLDVSAMTALGIHADPI
ncbi:hypothetical protein K431DRAFT_18600 [Polychaeton citri CBS 116435]|uniref:Uncharacterized protein n=1 Tax=Polychaeton citri CBS 116435 TaxID=1314669 RepID=A0A9P4UI47_9PEZI|nr:hypothetical protein K431DRAFT_18600 [Polychaeton citri CBS 116435]